MEQETNKNSKYRISITKSMQGEGECRNENDAYKRLKELEELFHRSEERYHALARATAQITWTMAPDGQVVEDIPFWRAYTGQSKAEVQGWR